MKDNLSRQFRRVPLNHGHWCGPVDRKQCGGEPCRFTIAQLPLDDGSVSVQVVQVDAERTRVRLLGEDGVILWVGPPEQVELLAWALSDAATIGRGSWPRYEVA